MTPIWSAGFDDRWLRCCSSAVQARRLRRLFDLYLPLRGAGIRVEALAEDWSYARIALYVHWHNRNYVDDLA